jgi:hypothetical protein
MRLIDHGCEPGNDYADDDEADHADLLLIRTARLLYHFQIRVSCRRRDDFARAVIGAAATSTS